MDSVHGLFAGCWGVDAARLLPRLVAANLAGARVGLPSICSAVRLVLEAAALQALRDDTVLCVESTCNQVNQFGGYTGMTPATFRARLEAIAGGLGLAPSHLVVGGDHLGPYPWRDEPAGRHGQGCGTCARLRVGGVHEDPPRRPHAPRHPALRPSCPLDQPGTGKRYPAHDGRVG
jgi:hypothetical protein